ncbi:MAG: Hsp33 family molecular chaperone HslO [Hyphomicrobium sp.]|nr:Hsp33 family molecular chaperone HslO [Hyphomicrobium sp.]
MAAPVTHLNLPVDDCVITFRTDVSGVKGRLVRLGPISHAIIAAHALPTEAAAFLGEIIVLAALAGSVLQDTGNIAVQTKTDGLVSVLYADCEAPGRLRGYARADTGSLQALSDAGETPARTRLIGQGHLALTFEAGGDSERYQGVIAFDGGTLADGAARYFEQREALPTFVRAAAAQHYAAASAASAAGPQWRCGGIMIQYPDGRLDGSGHLDGASDDDPQDDPWQRVRVLTETVEDHELLDPNLTAEQLLLRLYHEEGVIIERVTPLVTYCKCSREKITNVLATFNDDDIRDMSDDNGQITVTCEFCAKSYAFAAESVAKRQAE